MPDRTPSSAPTPDSKLALVLRFFWMLSGPVLLFVLAAMVIEQQRFTWLDGVFAAALVGVIAARYVDVTRFHGSTADGAPAGRKELVRYTGLITLGAAALWSSAHVAGQLLID
jgi:hypothetical protein